MLTPSHIAASYLLGRSFQLFDPSISNQEVVLVMIFGNIIDLDFLFGLLKGKKADQHHSFITHTPIGVIMIWFFWFSIQGHSYSTLVNIACLSSLFLHLILDEIGHWFCLLGWQSTSKHPQIQWLYPFKKHKEWSNLSNKNLLKEYFSKAKINVILEIILCLFAICFFISSKMAL